MDATELEIFRERFANGRIIEYDQHIKREGPSPTIDAGKLQTLLEEENGPHAALKLRGFEIASELRLSERRFDFLISFSNCVFLDAIILNRSEFRSFRLTHCHVEKFIAANQISVLGDVEIAARPGGARDTVSVQPGGARIERNLTLDGARIGGGLDCRGLEIYGQSDYATLSLVGAEIGKDIQLNAASTGDAAKVRGKLDARSLRVGGSFLASRAVVQSSMSLSGARIEGGLDCREMTIDSSDRIAPALDLAGARIGAEALFDALPENAGAEAQGAAINGWVKAEALEIGRTLSFARAKIWRAREFDQGREILEGPRPVALSCMGARVGNTFKLNGLRANGIIDISSADVGGVLSFTGCELRGGTGEDRNIIRGRGLKTGGPIYLNGTDAIHGGVSFANATCGGKLDCSGLRSPSEKSMALDLEQITIASDFELSQPNSGEKNLWRFAEINLRQAQIGGRFRLEQANMATTKENLIDARHSTIGGGLEIIASSLSGELEFSEAHIGGDFDVQTSEISGMNASGQLMRALGLNKATVEGDVVIRTSVIHGPIDARQLIARDVVVEGCGGAAAEEGAHRTRPSLDLSRAKLSGRLALLCRTERGERRQSGAGGSLSGAILLAGTRCLEFEDDAEFWSKTSGNDFDHFVYETLGPKALGEREDDLVKRRLAWLRSQKKQSPFRPQPYRQLSKVLRSMGRVRAANRISEHRARREQRPTSWLLRFLYSLYGGVAGFGYNLGRAAGFLLLLYLGALLIAEEAWRAAAYAPADLDAISGEAWKSCAVEGQARSTVHCWVETSGDLGGGRSYEVFNAAYYAVDVVVPLIDLDKEDRWTPVSAPAPMTDKGLVGALVAAGAAALGQPPPPVESWWWRPDMAWVARYFEPAITLLGWLLTTFIAFGLSRSLLPR